MILAANSFSNYCALTRQTTVSPARTYTRLAAASFTKAVWTANSEEHSRPPHDDFHSVKRGLLVNTTLALVLVFAVAASGPRQRS
jgi:hypothetical protein